MSSRPREIPFEQKLSTIAALRQRQRSQGENQRVQPSSGVIIPPVDRTRANTNQTPKRQVQQAAPPAAPMLTPSTQKPSSRPIPSLASSSPMASTSHVSTPALPPLPQTNFLPGPLNLSPAQINALANGDSSSMPFQSPSTLPPVSQSAGSFIPVSHLSPVITAHLLPPNSIPQPTFVTPNQQLPTGPPTQSAPPIPAKPASRPASSQSSIAQDFEVDINEVLYKIDHARILVSIAGLQGSFNMIINSVSGTPNRFVVSDNHLTPQDTDFDKFEELFSNGAFSEQEVLKAFIDQARITFIRPVKVTHPPSSIVSSVSPTATPSTNLMCILTYFFGNLIATNNNELVFDQALVPITDAEENALYEKYELFTDYFVKGNTLALVDGKMLTVRKTKARRDMIADIPIGVLTELLNFGFVNHLSNSVRYSLETAGLFVEPINRDGIIVFVRAYDQHIFEHILDNAETLPIGMVPI